MLMEKLQGPINPCLLGEGLEVGCNLEEENGSLGLNYGQYISNRFEDPHYILQSLEDKMPFLQMLQSVEAPPLPQVQQQPSSFPIMQEPNFQLLLRLQHQKMMMMKQWGNNNNNMTNNNNNMTNNSQSLSCYELDSCVTNNSDIMNMNLHTSPVKSEVQVTPLIQNYCNENLSPSPKCDDSQQVHVRVQRGGRSKKSTQMTKTCSDSPSKERERRKRKRSSRPAKNKEEVENQRMTHIAVERNRRRQMNEHLSALRSLMPPSYVQRGDQASIIGGAIDFVKELEQLLQSLQAQKRIRQCEENGGDVSACSSSSSSSNLLSNVFMGSSASTSSSLQFSNSLSHANEEGNGNVNGNDCGMKGTEEFIAENRSALADIEVVVIQSHVNLKIQCQRRPGQLLKAIVALEDLRLSILHLNITSLHNLVHYSFNLKIEDDCKLGSADEVARAVHQIFSLINMS